MPGFSDLRHACNQSIHRSGLDPHTLMRPERSPVLTVTRFQCRQCGKLTTGRTPKGGDGTVRYPSRHRLASGRECEGMWREAKWIDVPKTKTKTK